MPQSEAIDFSNDDVWSLWEPLIEAVRPKGIRQQNDAGSQHVLDRLTAVIDDRLKRLAHLR